MTIWKGSTALLAAVTLATGLLSGPSVAQEPEYEWKMATGWGGGPLMDIGAQAFADRLEELSNGRFEVQVFPGGGLGNALKVSDTVKNGIAEMGHTWMGYDWGKDPGVVLFGGYAGSFDTERMLHWLYRGGGVELQRDYRLEKFGVISMPLFIRTAEVFLHSHKPVRTLDDLQGLKLRTAGAWLDMAKDLGAAPVTTPGAEVYTMLERKAIDATEWGTLWEDIAPGFHKITKYVIIPGVHQPTAPFELVINKDAWESLSPEDQELIEMVARMVTLESWLTIGQEDAKAVAFYRENGNEIIELAPEVQYAAREKGLEWARGQAEQNEWFKKVFENQQAFEKLWQGADRYRKVMVKDAE
jgi:TRAP-type mannitol/chloroaromatic compound transport system substrate-binding protein